ncbi:MAG TPA: hypothetical protein VL361_09755 [Candidatus Limnocylindrales bacterium]|nr:hypothetical protein [Candidatus Limnocylindrales bacterium]
MNKSTFHWAALESLRGTAASALIWRERLGETYNRFSAAFLQRTATLARSYPCPQGCGCAHEVIHHGPTDIIGICRCESWQCDDVVLKPDDLLIWELSWSKLGRALCRALGLENKPAQLHLSGTRQIGSWSAQAVPVLLTIQPNQVEFRANASALIARLRQPFILLTPTSRHVDACARELLGNVGAGVFPLETCVRFTAQGMLEPTQAPGELFSRFTAQPAQDLPEDVARRAFALAEQLDSEDRLKPPTVLTVFRLYCIEELSAGQIARRTQVSKATILRRLQMIHAKIGVEPRALRRVSTHFDKIEADLADSRAEHIHRRRLIYDQEEGEEEG